MAKSDKRLSKKAGLPPGSLVYVGEKKDAKIKISVIDFSPTSFTEKVLQNASECLPYNESNTISWINIDGLHDMELMEDIGKVFNLHPLLLEDVLNTHHRPKVEEFTNCILVSLKMLGVSEDGETITTEQVSLVLGEGWIISFQEQEGDIFGELRERLRKDKGTIRQRSTDYLFYRFIDTIVDHYFFVTEHIGDVIEDLEERVLASPDQETLHEIQYLKRQLIELRKMIMPLREVVAFLTKDSSSLITDNITRYLRDLYEHIIMVNESIESQKDTVSSLMDLHMSGLSNKMNQVMKVLTIIATIFIPLTFIAGIYGMNFDHMPELHLRYGYFGVWAVMIIVFITMLFYFKRKKWL